MRAALNIQTNTSLRMPVGFAGWLLERLRLRLRLRTTQSREMRLMESLSLGGKRQLMLVECGGQRYLVGAGAESVETIVPVVRQTCSNMNENEVCR